MKFDYLIVGAGFFGSVFAREMSNLGKKCFVIDKRTHIGGNAYSYKKEGIDIHKYGPHIFHTNEKKIWDYVNNFDNFVPYFNRGKVKYKNRIFSFPINLMTFNQLWGVKTPEEAKRMIESKKKQISNPKNLEDFVLSQVGEEIYEIFIRGYTRKQWGREPKDLPISIIKRIPIRFSFNEFSVDDKYQGVPENGYDRLFENLLDGITYEVGIDYFSNREYYNNLAHKIIYTGCIDQFFDYKFGNLEYRGLRFENEIREMEDFQGNALMNYTEEDIPYTRICEHKHFLPFIKTKKTIITKEFPIEWKNGLEPYYPINNEINNQKFNLYLEESKKQKNVIFGGRLGKYKYYDMHQVVANALKMAKMENK